jgi:hypothetical protein
MAIDRHDNGSADDGSFHDDGHAKAGGRDKADGGGRPDQGRTERPDHRAVPGKDRPVAEEERDRAGLYADMRAEADAEASGDGGRAGGDGGRDPETRDKESRETGARDNTVDHGPRPPDRDAPRTTDDGGWEWKGLRLGPEANRIADDAIAARRSAEGRDSQGNYGDDGITPAMRRVEASLEHGSLVPDTEKFALKGPDRFKEKLAKMMERRPESSPSELTEEIHDGIRYTFVFDADHYTDGTKEVCAELTELRYEITRLANRWSGEEYKGINSQWNDPQSGQSFEIQFHTPESWDAKQKTHDTYEKIENPETPVREVEQLRAYQREVSSGIELPDRWKEITDYRKPEP